MHSVLMLRSIIVAVVACMVFGGSTLAQTLTPPPEGITVIGLGQASAIPDSTLIQISLGTAMSGPPTASQPGATPGASETEAVAPVVSALVDAGVPEADIEVIVPPFLGNAFSGPYGPVSALISVSADAIGGDEIGAIISAATVGAADARLLVAGITIIHTVNDCSTLMQQARQAAFDNATSLAAAEADIVGVAIGDVVAVRDSMNVPTFNTDPSMGYSADGSCSYNGMSGTFGFSSYGGPMPYDLSTDPVVIVYAATEVTFGIDSAATPAS